MMLKAVILALAVGSAVVQAGVQASRLDALFDQMTGKTDGRIVGGVEAVPHSFPWQAALLTRVGAPTAFCGGSIVTDEYVMTAGHCCAGRAPSSLKIRVGAHDLRSTTEASAKTVSVSKITIHPQYDDDSMDNDFCLLKLAEKLTFNAQLQSVHLADVSDGPVGQTCTVSGWGNDAQGNGPAQNGRAIHSRLRKVEVNVVDNAVCNKKYESSVYSVSVTGTMICGSAPGKDSCQGDSGGPFVCRNAAGAYKLVGVVSWGYGCADARYPGVYARTSVALDWIAKTVSS